MNLNICPWEKYFTRKVLWSDTAILVYLSLVKLIIHLLTANNYGYYGDEFYWLDLTKRLDFGYVDVPPLLAYVGAFWCFLFGRSLFWIHVLPALAGAVMVFYAGLLARELGGGRFAQSFAALIVLVAPIWLMFNSWFTYEPLEQLSAIILFYYTVRIIKEETPGRWIGLGVIAGLAIMTKLTMLFMVGAVALAILAASPRRKSFLTPWPWLALAIVGLICTPYIIWQWSHNWPLITYWQGYAVNPHRPHPGLFEILKEFAWYLNPFLFPLSLAGLFYLLYHKEGRKYLPLGVSFLILAFVYIFRKMEARIWVAAFFPVLVAGAVWLDEITGVVHGKGMAGIRWGYLGLSVICSLLVAPFFLPLLPIRDLKAYVSVTPRFVVENLHYQPDEPSFFTGYRFGWSELIEKITEVYQGLPETEQKHCLVWTEFYAQAGAVNLLGEKYKLPKAISTSLNYYFWGPDPEQTGKDPEVVILVSSNGSLPYTAFDQVTEAAFITGNPYSTIITKSLVVYVCRKPKRPLKEIWPTMARFI